MAAITTGDRGEINAELEREVERFITAEAALLDEWKLAEWLELFTEDARYWVPATDLPEGRAGESLGLIDDDIVRLRARVERLLSRHAHREFPWSRTRRLVTNARIIGISGGEIRAAASFLVYRIRNRHMDPYVGHYEYVFRRVDGGLKIRARSAILDLEALDPHATVSFIL
ncbi:MAG: aromatic-ring-hydroxylating dioxygenase subunit beta [Candidatus Binataceae bacterium]